MGTHHQRLGLKIGNTADAQMSVHLIDILVELRTERCILYVVNGSVVTFFFAVDCHAGTSGSQMGMIIRSKEQVEAFLKNVISPILEANKDLLGVKAEINV